MLVAACCVAALVAEPRKRLRRPSPREDRRRPGRDREAQDRELLLADLRRTRAREPHPSVRGRTARHGCRRRPRARAGPAVPRHPRPGVRRRRAGPAVDRVRPRTTRATTSSTPTTRTARATSRSTSCGHRRTRRRRRAPRRQVIVIQHPGASNHNGGQLQFGPDGELYVGTGDGGGAGDPREQRPEQAAACSASSCGSTRTGTAPRPTRSRRATRTSASPARDEIYALGLRNPFRFSFDRQHAIAIGDVGQDRWEEIDYRGPRRPARSELRLGPLRGRPPLRLPGRQRGPRPNALPTSDLRLPAQRTGRLRDHRRLRGREPRPEQPATGATSTADNCNGDLRSFVPRTPQRRSDKALGVRVSQPELVRRGPGTGRSTWPRSTARSSSWSTSRPRSSPAPSRSRVHCGMESATATRAHRERRLREPDAGPSARELRGPPAGRRLGDRSPSRSTRPRGSPRWSAGSARRSPTGRRSASRARAAGSARCATGSSSTTSTLDDLMQAETRQGPRRRGARGLLPARRDQLLVRARPGASWPTRRVTPHVAAAAGHRRAKIVYHPYPVVGIISPWNFPLILSARRRDPGAGGRLRAW